MKSRLSARGKPEPTAKCTTTCNTEHARLRIMSVYTRTAYKNIALNRTKPHIPSVPRANLERTSSVPRAHRKRTRSVPLPNRTAGTLTFFFERYCILNVQSNNSPRYSTAQKKVKVPTVWFGRGMLPVRFQFTSGVLEVRSRYSTRQKKLAIPSLRKTVYMVRCYKRMVEQRSANAQRRCAQRQARRYRLKTLTC